MGSFRGEITLVNLRDGEKGEVGQSNYIHIKYANKVTDETGTHFKFTEPTDLYPDWGEAPGDYLGQYSDYDKDDSTSVDDYTWTLIKAVTITKVEKFYVISKQGEIEPVSGWDNTRPTPIPGEFLWTKTITTYSDGKVFTDYSVTRSAIDGVGIAQTIVRYAVSDDGLLPPDDVIVDLVREQATLALNLKDGYDFTISDNTIHAQNNKTKEVSNYDLKVGETAGQPSTLVGANSIWTEEMPDVKVGQYLWTKTIIYYTDNKRQPFVSYSVSRVGKDGQAGTDGAPGKSAYIHIKYATRDIDGNYVFTQPEPPDYPEIGEKPGPYIGQYTDDLAGDSDKIGDYKWTKIEGSDGKDGTKIVSHKVEYATWPNGTTAPKDESKWHDTIQQPEPNEFLWTRLTVNYDGDVDPQVSYSVVKNGGPGANGSSSYLHIKYATKDADGYHFTGRTSPDGEIGEAPGPYIGQYVNDQAADSNPQIANYTWSKVEGEDGADGVGIASSSIDYAVSADGAKPPEGADVWTSWNEAIAQLATQEKKNWYLWTRTTINYEGGKPSTTAYSVSRNGKDGKSGQTAYIHIKYATKDVSGNYVLTPIDQSSGYNHEGEKPGPYIGQYTDNNPTDDLDVKKYKWSKIEGTDGQSITIVKATTSYALGDSGTIKPNSWNENFPEQIPIGKFLWTRVYVEYSDGSNTESYSVTKNGENSYLIIRYSNDGGVSFTKNNGKEVGKYLGQRTCPQQEPPSPDSPENYTWSLIQGENGVDGNGIKSYEILYGTSKSGTECGSVTNWQKTIPEVQPGYFLWTKTTINYTVGDPSTTYSVAKNGDPGVGIGSNEITYAKSNQGENAPNQENDWKTTISALGLKPGDFLWTRTILVYTDGNRSKPSYSVSRNGNDGNKGQDGAPGTDGKTSYIHIKYSNDGGKTFTANDGEDVGTYIGQYTDFNSDDSSDVTKYKWSKIEGKDGKDGQNGQNGQNGQDGNGIKQCLVEYAVSDNGINPPQKPEDWHLRMEDLPPMKPGSYLWTKTTLVFTDSTMANAVSYSVARNGSNGLEGTGIRRTITLYAASNDGENAPIDDGVFFTLDGSKIAELKSIPMICQDGTLAIKRDNDALPEGFILNHFYLEGASKTWTAKIPKLSPGQYLWTKVVTQYTDDKLENSVSYSVARIGEDGKTGAPGPTYVIDTSQNEILKFPVDSKDGNNKTTWDISISPDDLVFSVSKYDMLDDQISADKQILQEKSNEKIWDIEYYNGTTWVSSPTFKKHCTVSQFEVTFRIADLLTAVKKDESTGGIYYNLFKNDGTFRIQYYKKRSAGESILVASRNIRVLFGNDMDKAKLGIYATGIVASVQDSKLIFNANGLTVQNGGIRIKGDEYTVIDEARFEELRKAKQAIYIANAEGYKEHLGVWTEQLTFFEKKIEECFYATESGNLVLKGNIYASNGDFTGTINAKAGKISGLLEVGSGEVGSGTGYLIIDGANKLIKSSNYEAEKTGFQLSSDGSIEANTITLGTSAEIKDYIKLGNNCFIYNPVNSGSNFIKIRQFDDTTGTLGKDIFTIAANGSMILAEEARIQTRDYLSGFTGWSIDADKAEFNNVTVRGTIESSVFSYGKVTAVGGILLVRPSTIIENIEISAVGIIVNVKVKDAGFQEGDYCSFDSNSNVLYKLVEKQDNGLTLVFENPQPTSTFAITTENTKDYIGKVLVDYGQPTQYSNGLKNSVSIAINSSSNSAAVAPNAISVFENDILAGGVSLIKKENPTSHDYKLNKKPRIILGEMNGDPAYGGLTGYGLYADNVYLKGQLIAEQAKRVDSNGQIISSSFYSGIHTQSEIPMLYGDIYFPVASDDKRVGNILLWAGAKGNAVKDIQEAPFKVDTYGNLYAGSGYFNGTIISNASITAAKIKTAVIEGWEQGTQAALTIRNASEAIKFISETKQDGEKTVMELNDTALTLTVPLKIGNFKISPDSGAVSSTVETDKIDVVDGSGTTSISLTSDKIVLKKDDKSSIIRRNSVGQAFVFSTEEGNDGEKEAASLSTEGSLNIKALKGLESFALGEKVQFKVSGDGFNIFISE